GSAPNLKPKVTPGQDKDDKSGGDDSAKAKASSKDTGNVDVTDDSGKETLDATKAEEGRPSREVPFRKAYGLSKRYWYAIPNQTTNRTARKTLTRRPD